MRKKNIYDRQKDNNKIKIGKSKSINEKGEDSQQTLASEWPKLT